MWVWLVLALCWAPKFCSAKGGRIDLTHWASPSLAAGISMEQKLQAAIRHSNSRFQAMAGGYQTPVSPFGGGYLMEIRVGTPPQSLHAIADTGSDLVWLKAEPCILCDRTPVFHPSQSSSFQPLSCSASSCRLFNSSSCDSPLSDCSYSYSYLSGLTSGRLISDSLTLFSSHDVKIASSSSSSHDVKIASSSSPDRLPNFVFGNSGSDFGFLFFQGVVGLGKGPLSLSSQLGATGAKFSYCLVDMKSSSSSSPLLFGDDAVMHGSNVQSTPIISSSKYPSFYVVELHSLALNGVTIENSGTTVIDSGTTLTYLQEPTYSRIVEAFTSSIDLPTTWSRSGLKHCYNTLGKDGYKVPTLSIQFNGAILTPPSNNYFVSFEPDSHVMCLAISSSQGFGLNVLGNLMQQNYQILYDRQKSILSFAPTNCKDL